MSLNQFNILVKSCHDGRVENIFWAAKTLRLYAAVKPGKRTAAYKSRQSFMVGMEKGLKNICR